MLAYEEATYDQEKNHSKGLERPVPDTQTGPGMCLFPPDRLENMIHRALGGVYKVALLQ